MDCNHQSKMKLRTLNTYLEGESLPQVIAFAIFCTISISFATFAIFYILLPTIHRNQYTEFTNCTVSNSKYACAGWTCTIQFTFFNSFLNKTEVGYLDGCKNHLPCWQLKVILIIS